MKNPIAAGRHAKKKGASRMAEFGYKQVAIWLDQVEAGLVIFAAKKAEMKLATWVRKIAVEAAKKAK